MRQQLVLEFDETFPFGKVVPYDQDDEIIVVKKVSFGNPAERTRLLNKADFLKMLSSNLNIVALLGYEQGPDSIDLVYEYIPFDFFTLLQKNCDNELSQARCTLLKLTTQLETLGLKTNIHQGTVGLDQFRRLKYYVSIDDVPDTHFEQSSEEMYSSKDDCDCPEQSELDIVVSEAPGTTLQSIQTLNKGKLSSLHLTIRDETQPRMSDLSHQSESVKKTTASHIRMDGLLQKINVRLQELSSYRRKTTPSRCNYKQLTLPQNQRFGQLSNCTQFRADSSASTQIDNPKQLKLENPAEKSCLQQKQQTLASIGGSRLKYSSSTDNLLGEYQMLKTQRKQMLERIRAVIEKTDSMLEGHRSRKSPSPITLLNI